VIDKVGLIILFCFHFAV